MAGGSACSGGSCPGPPGPLAVLVSRSLGSKEVYAPSSSTVPFLHELQFSVALLLPPTLSAGAFQVLFTYMPSGYPPCCVGLGVWAGGTPSALLAWAPLQRSAVHADTGCGAHLTGMRSMHANSLSPKLHAMAQGVCLVTLGIGCCAKAGAAATYSCPQAASSRRAQPQSCSLTSGRPREKAPVP